MESKMRNDRERQSTLETYRIHLIVSKERKKKLWPNNIAENYTKCK